MENKVWNIKGVKPEVRRKLRTESVRRGITLADLLEELANKLK